MRILQLVNIGFEAGGAEKSVRIIRDGLRLRGHEVQIVASTRLLTGEPYEQDVFADHLVPMVSGRGPARALGYLWHREAYRRISDVIREFRPDCVHLHTIGEFSPAALVATRDCPRILTVHGPESWTRKLLRWNLASAASGSLSPADRAMLTYLACVQRPAFLPLIRRVDRVIAPSQYFANAIQGDVGRVPIHVLPNGIETTAVSTPVPGTAHVVYVGRLERVKGVHILLDAYRRLAEKLPEATLSIVGDGRERARLERQAADLVAAGGVRFHGWLDQDAVSRELAAASVVALPSLWPENFPTVALEALQHGRPLVGSRVGGIPELIGPDNGALVEPGDPEALADELARLLSDPSRTAELGRGSAARSERYGVNEFLSRILTHYREVVAACAS